MADCSSRAATLKRRIIIQNVNRISDGQGGFTENWVDAAEVYASIEPVKAWERYQAAQMATPVSHKIVMRFNKLITSASRLVYDKRVFAVKEVINDREENRYLVIRAIEQA